MKFYTKKTTEIDRAELSYRYMDDAPIEVDVETSSKQHW